MNLPLISFVITCYNSEKVIDKCIESIYKNGLDNDEFEVLAYNDGSTDKTQELLMNYSKNFSNFRVEYDGVNRGMVNAKDHVIQKAEGEYIWVIDHDDEIAVNAGLLLKAQMNSYPDVISFKYGIIKENGEKVDLNWGFDNCSANVIYSPANAYMKQHIHWTLWSKIFRRKFICDFNLHVDSRPDDINFCTKVFACASSLVLLDKVLYYWRMEVTSETWAEGYFSKVLPWMTDGASFINRSSKTYISENKKFWNYVMYIYVRWIYYQTFVALNSKMELAFVRSTLSSAIIELRPSLNQFLSYSHIWGSRYCVLLHIYCLFPHLYTSIYCSLKLRKIVWL